MTNFFRTTETRLAASLSLILFAACSDGVVDPPNSPSAPAAPSFSEAADGSATSVSADFGGQFVNNSIPEQAVRASSAGDIRLGVWYPYGGSDGVPPQASLGAAGISASFITGNLNAATLAEYDVIFIGRPPMLGFASVSIENFEALRSWISNGGGLIGESNAILYDSDSWRRLTWSSELSAIAGISGPQQGYDHGVGSLTVRLLAADHPLAKGLPSSFTLSGFFAQMPRVKMSVSKNPLAIQVGEVDAGDSWTGSSDIVTASYGKGCTVYFPTAAGFGEMNWASNPDYEKLFINAVKHCGGPSDATPPTISVTVSGTLGDNDWYTSDVSASWSVVDAESPITSTDGCDAASLKEDSESVVFTCTATSAGGTATRSVEVKRDATNPLISYSGNAGSYTVDQAIAISCSAEDAMSGVASHTCELVEGEAYTFDLGTNTRSAEATDRAGNGGSGSVSFTVAVTHGSLCTLVKRFTTQRGIANSLCQKLDAASAAAARGNQNASSGALQAFVNEVHAQSGKAISPADAAVLTRLAGAL